MKKYLNRKLFVILVFLTVSLVEIYAVPSSGIRFLKLGNTYREAGSFDKAEEFLTRGSKYFKNKTGWEYKYWRAVADEYFGLLYFEVSEKQENNDNKEYFKQLSIEHFTRALSSYKKLITQKDGSQIPLEQILASIDLVEGNDAKNKHNKESKSEKYARVGSDVLNYERLKLREIPIGVPSEVKNLTLAENKFRDFPSGLVNFKDLEYLNLSQNKIKTISADIEQLTKLNWLDLSNNNLKELPQTICNLQNLEELNLMNNKLKTLPACFCKLKKLKILNLKGNNLSYSVISNLQKCMPNTNIFVDEYIKKTTNNEN
jgi:Leucine-rich repeat (LRR) protein